jgi:dTDP-4-dehydrorhamnose 3,5-epimerase
VQYKCSTVYDPATESGIAWDDPELKVAWPLEAIEGGVPLLSERDKTNQSFAAWKKAAGL